MTLWKYLGQTCICPGKKNFVKPPRKIYGSHVKNYQSRSYISKIHKQGNHMNRLLRSEYLYALHMSVVAGKAAGALSSIVFIWVLHSRKENTLHVSVHDTCFYKCNTEAKRNFTKMAARQDLRLNFYPIDGVQENHFRKPLLMLLRKFEVYI